MSTAVETAGKRIDAAVREFGESLGLLTHLTVQQRRAITAQAGQLAKQCMRIQCDMDQQLVSEAFDG